MYWDQFRYFAITYSERSFSAAARSIPMSVQGISKAIHALEDELGVPLFETRSGALIPTSYADALYERAEKWELDLTELKHEFDHLKSSQKTTVRVGAAVGVSALLGQEFFTSFHRAHPHIVVDYEEQPDLHCDEMLQHDVYDLAITVAPFDNHFVTTEFYTMNRYIWVNADNTLANKKTLSITDFEGQDIGVVGPSFKNYGALLQACKEKGVLLGEIITSSELFWLYQYAKEGRCLSFTVPNLREYYDEERVRCLPVKGFPWTIGISHLPSHHPFPAEQNFIDYIVSWSEKIPSYL